MVIGNINDLFAKEIISPEAKNAKMQVLVSPKEGWEGYVMRVLIVGPEGYTPKHRHDWPHINYIIEGEGELLVGDNIQSVTAGSYAYVPANQLHQFRNIGRKTFKFICIVPEKGHTY